MKTLDTLVEDVYALFDPETPHEVNEENLEDFCEELKDLLRSRLLEREGEVRIRFSNLGQPDRKAWMAAHPAEEDEKLSSKTYMKFMWGAVVESLVLFLAKEAGHSVERQQEEVSVDGIKGHIDAVVDGVVVDVKSASSFGFKKFKTNDVISDDPFGYVEQLAGYANVLTPGEPAAWIAMDKSSASLCVTSLSSSVIESHKPEERIAHLKEVVKQDEPPPLCYSPVPDGTSGNMKLATACGYCPHKRRCFPEMRVFAYSTGPRFLSRVVNLPKVPEIGITVPEDM